MVQDIRLADSVPQQIKMLNDKIERLARKPQMLGAVGAYSATSATGTINTTDTIQPEAVTFDAVQGRRYKITHVRSEAGTQPPPSVTVRFRVASGTTVAVTDTQIQFFTWTPSGLNDTVTRIAWWVATFTGKATIGVSTSRNATNVATIDTSRTRDLLIEDIGA